MSCGDFPPPKNQDMFQNAIRRLLLKCPVLRICQICVVAWQISPPKSFPPSYPMQRGEEGCRPWIPTPLDRRGRGEGGGRVCKLFIIIFFAKTMWAVADAAGRSEERDACCCSPCSSRPSPFPLWRRARQKYFFRVLHAYFFRENVAAQKNSILLGHLL